VEDGLVGAVVVGLENRGRRRTRSDCIDEGLYRQ
jgi:hypothetical protein